MIVSELFIPKTRITIKDEKDIKKFIKIYNGKKNIYLSVYKYKDFPSAVNACVDKVFLDFDYDEDLKFYDDVRKVADYLKQMDYMFYIRFSGRGFHIFVLMEKEELKQPKVAIRKFVNDVHQRTGTKSDMSVVGDLRRVSRALGTKNLKTRLYCIPITYEQLKTLSYEDVCKIGKRYNGDCDHINGYTKLSLRPFDKQKKFYKSHNVSLSNVTVSTEFPPCINNLLQQSDLGYHERRELIIYLRDDGYLEEEIESMLEKTLSLEKFTHCIEEEHQLEYLMNRDDILFSSCPTQKANGICCSDTCEGQNLYI